MSPKVRHSTPSLASLVMTAMPSLPTCSSMNSMPLSSQAAICSSLILDEASLTSASPLQNSSKPSPVPGPSTTMSTSALACRHLSATEIAMGTKVQAPGTSNEPVSSQPPELPPAA